MHLSVDAASVGIAFRMTFMGGVAQFVRTQKQNVSARTSSALEHSKSVCVKLTFAGLYACRPRVILIWSTVLEPIAAERAATALTRYLEGTTLADGTACHCDVVGLWSMHIRMRDSVSVFTRHHVGLYES